MKYRKMGKLDWEISEASLGVLRKEEAVAAAQEIDLPERIEAIRYAVDNGVNYINLGFPFYFENPAKACEYVKSALSGGYRDHVKVAVNIPSREISSQQDLDNAIDAQLKLFDLDRVDFCLIDGVFRATWDTLKSLDIASWASKASDSGKVGYIGLNFHDDPHYLRNIFDTYPQWDVIQMELSMLDYKHHPGVGGFRFSEEHDIAVIATDITKAGRLLENIPESVRDILNESALKMSQEERCVRWTLGFKEVSSTLMSVQSEFSSTEQVEKYLSYIDGFTPEDIGISERLEATRIREAYYAQRDCMCTACRCCMPCPIGIDAPRLIELTNDEKMFSNHKIPQLQYVSENHQNIKCTHCGVCDKQCPRHFPVQRIVNSAYERYVGK